MHSGGAHAACTPDSSAGNRGSEAKSSSSGVAITGTRGQPRTGGQPCGEPVGSGGRFAEPGRAASSLAEPGRAGGGVAESGCRGDWSERRKAPGAKQ